jgi:hypothetical protein
MSTAACEHPATHLVRRNELGAALLALFDDAESRVQRAPHAKLTSEWKDRPDIAWVLEKRDEPGVTRLARLGAGAAGLAGRLGGLGCR